ncbi:oligosaccharide flippase family protein [Candidatus Peregrinibacteria bacterium]|nr:oligosaccharide flippase family protein [Candidatus Peregrinibacteria bacterium]
MSTRRIAASTLWQIASQAAMAFLSILASKFVAIGLSKEFAGYYNSSYGYLQIFAIIADFGLYAVSVREVSKAENTEKTLGALLVLRTIILIVSMGIGLSFVWIVPAWRGTPFPIGVTIASLVPIFTLLAGMLRTVFQVQYKMHFVFVAEVLQRVVTTAGIGLFILAGVRLSTDLTVFKWFLWIGGIGSLVLFLLSAIYAERLMRIRPCFDGKLLIRFTKLAAPYGIAYLLMAMYRQLDVASIALLRPDFALQNAYYGFAGRVEDMAFLFPTFLLNSVLPTLTNRLNLKQDVSVLLGKTLLILILFGTTFFLFSFLWAKPFTLLFTTPSYLSTADHAGSDTAFALMSIPMFLNGIVLFSFYVFLAHHAWQRLAVSFGIGVIITIALNLLLTPRYGFVGAASALIVVHVFLSILLLPQTFRLQTIAIGRSAILQWLAYSVILAVPISLLAPMLTSAFRTIIAGSLMIPFMIVLALVLRIQHTLQWQEM